MDLIIDSTAENTTIALGIDNISFPSRDEFGNQQIVVEIDKLLRNSKVSPSQINSIVVNPGPGPFTGIRVGVSVANVLARAWNKPIKYLGGELVDLAIPNYNREANITKKRPPLK